MTTSGAAPEIPRLSARPLCGWRPGVSLTRLEEVVRPASPVNGRGAGHEREDGWY
jgi:hypothetical protein